LSSKTSVSFFGFLYDRSGGIVIMIDNQIGVADWADDSEGLPEGLFKIISAIGQIAPDMP
jgi:hypothetical protein